VCVCVCVYASERDMAYVCACLKSSWSRSSPGGVALARPVRHPAAPMEIAAALEGTLAACTAFGAGRTDPASVTATTGATN
jgi:hypothetical protein